MICANELCFSYGEVLGWAGLIIGIIAAITYLLRGRSGEPGIGSHEASPNEFHDDQEEEQETPVAKVGDKLQFLEWVFIVTTVDEDEEQIWGDLVVRIPEGGKFLSLQRDYSEEYQKGLLGFTIVYDPGGNALAKTITYDPDPNDPPIYDDYTMLIDEIVIQ